MAASKGKSSKKVVCMFIGHIHKGKTTNKLQKTPNSIHAFTDVSRENISVAPTNHFLFYTSRKKRKTTEKRKEKKQACKMDRNPQ